MCSIKYSNRRHLIIQPAHSMLRFDAHSPCCVVILMTLSLLLVLIHCWVISASPFEISKQIYWIIHVYSEQEREPCTNERTKYFFKKTILALFTSIFNEFQCIFISFTSIVHAFYLPFWSNKPKQFYCNVNTISVPDDAPFPCSFQSTWFPILTN